ncbi:MAG: DUF2071 domain-containing protein, partial [Leifsonia sp.]
LGELIAEPSELETWLTARWGLHVHAWGRTLHVPNEHPTWPLHRAELRHLDENLIAAAGIAAPAGAPVSVLFSPGVQVAFGRPHQV